MRLIWSLVLASTVAFWYMIWLVVQGVIHG